MFQAVRRIYYQLLSIALLVCGLNAASQPLKSTGRALEAGFLNPPESAKVWSWWHWMNGNVSKEGITADLEAMKRVGIGGLYNFHVGHQLPINGTVDFMSPQWWSLSKFAASEASRLGLEFGFQNCPGWSASGGPDVKVEHSMQKLVWSETIVAGPGKYFDTLPRPKIDPVYNHYRDVAVVAFPVGKDSIVPVNAIINITEKMGASGRLEWEIPSGNWMIQRFGHTTTGKKNAPAPIGGEGLECDKMSKEAVKAFFESYPAKYLDNASELKKGIRHIEIDSYEAGLQDWTPQFRAEFVKRRGYDPLCWLPAWSNRTIENKSLSSRFKNDMKRTIAELYDENYFGYFAELVHKYPGLQLTLEPYDGPFNPFDVAARADVLMGEYWVQPATWGWNWTAEVVAAAHVLGKKIVSAESLTGWPHLSKWQNDPYSLKSSADRAFALGVNRMVLHTIAHQPWADNFRPGITMAFWGTHFGRTQTWWEQSEAWFDYLTRCQYLLQQGEFVSDILCLNKGLTNLPEGYRADICSELQLLNLVKAKNGKIVLPHGKTYRLLVVSDTILMPEVARKIKALADAGVPVVGKPFATSPSLQNFPACDTEVKAVSDILWKDGKMKDKPLEKLLREKSISPDFFTTDKGILWVHRKIGESEVYFVSNQLDSTRIVNCSFRVSGKQPELWDAVTGRISVATSFKMQNGQTILPLKLDPSGSFFVVFRKKIAATSGSSAINWPNYTPIQVLKSGWMVHFDPKWGGPETVSFPTLTDWSKNDLPGIKYYSGTATYTTQFELKEVATSLFLDLGKVKNLAEVRLNGVSLGVLWKPPFIADITKTAKPGKNELVVKVTNLWANRLIGDEQEPADVKWDTKMAGLSSVKNAQAGYKLLELPSWFLENKARPSAGRFTFTTFNYFSKESPLLESGLLGPVRLLSGKESAAQFDLYLLMGQSNMAGRGEVEAQDTITDPRVFMLNKAGEWVPAKSPLHFGQAFAGTGMGISFGKLMAEKSNQDIGLIPCAVGGTSISMWMPGGYDKVTKTHPYNDAVQRARIALQHGQLKGILWHQGEADASAEKMQCYSVRFDSLLMNLQKDLSVDIRSIPVVVGELGRFYADKAPETKNFNLLLHSMVAPYPNMSVVSSEGLTHKGDSVHFDAASQRELGKRYADKMIELGKVVIDH